MIRHRCKSIVIAMMVFAMAFTIGTVGVKSIQEIKASEIEKPNQIITSYESNKIMFINVHDRNAETQYVHQQERYKIVPTCNCGIMRINFEMRVINPVIQDNIIEATSFQFTKQ